MKNFYGPYDVTFMGPAIWAGIKDELPPELVDKKVWITVHAPDVAAEPQVWNFDLEKAPENKAVWVALNDGLQVARTMRLKGTWLWLEDDEFPIAWQPFSTPDHPEHEG